MYFYWSVCPYSLSRRTLSMIIYFSFNQRVLILYKSFQCFNLQNKKPPFVKEVLSFSSVEVAGFEPATPCSQSRCADRTTLHLEQSSADFTQYIEPRNLPALYFVMQIQFVIFNLVFFAYETILSCSSIASPLRSKI